MYPIAKPKTKRMIKIIKPSFLHSFSFKRQNIPNPVLTINPDNKPPKDKPLIKYKLVIITDDAQLGIKPIKQDNKG